MELALFSLTITSQTLSQSLLYYRHITIIVILRREREREGGRNREGREGGRGGRGRGGRERREREREGEECQFIFHHLYSIGSKLAIK